MGNCMRTGQTKDEAKNNAQLFEANPLQEAEEKEAALPENPEIGQYLKTVPLLVNKLSDKEFAQLGGAMQIHRYNIGDAVIVEGAPGDEFFIIHEGEAIVSRKERNEHGEMVDVVLCPLKKGDYFGETALLRDTKRMATVTAKTPLTCLSLGRDTFMRMFGRDRFQFAKRGAISAEQMQQQQQAEVAGAAAFVREKSAATIELIKQAIRANVLFKNLDAEQLDSIVNEMHKKEVANGQSIIRQGDLGDNFYVVEEGNFSISVAKNKGEPPAVVAQRGPGTSFGELALLYNSPRAATITATANSVVWAIDRIPFRRILMKVSTKKLEEYENFLSHVPDISSLTSHERFKIAEALEEQTFPNGHQICRQGDVGDTFFIIKSGRVRITKVLAEGQAPVEVNVLEMGNYFGELALRRSEPRAATVTAVGTVVCLCMDRQAFINLMGPLEDMLKKQEELYSADPLAEAKEEKSGDRTLRIEKKDLQVIGTLGKGSFGHVQLVKDIKNPQNRDKTFALKAVSKSQIVQLGQQEHIMSEKNVMIMLDHPFLIRLYATFRDQNALYFLLEVCLGGELFTILRARTNFTEPTAKFYAACVVSAFEYMHSKNIIYRDLKPENLLLDDRGYLKVTDFGFAKIVTDRTWTLCGTPDYLAPEVVSGQGHGKGVDWWTLGILIYEMLASYPPFYDEDPMRTYAKIMHGQINFPKHFSAESIDLIRKLLNPKPTKRLGVMKGGATLIKRHPWFKGFDWNALESGTMAAPIIPKIKNAEDISNFDSYADDEPGFPAYRPGPGEDPNWDASFATTP
eukprot:TRINITY_DN2864_c0_g1_i9.p1 TRINITY_DN2864_c0_g1~~TRINITY_DN2864_c0_g1_i9.p1  ORF type:complete len:799 (+),score=343.37 TRINITY_DN2864_c0_g1_i9:177-2573(+)